MQEDPAGGRRANQVASGRRLRRGRVLCLVRPTSKELQQGRSSWMEIRSQRIDEDGEGE